MHQAFSKIINVAQSNDSVVGHQTKCSCHYGLCIVEHNEVMSSHCVTVQQQEVSHCDAESFPC